MRRFVRGVAVFYLTAPMCGVAAAVAISLWRAWVGGNPFLAAAAMIVGAAGAVMLTGLWRVLWWATQWLPGHDGLALQTCTDSRGDPALPRPALLGAPRREAKQLCK
jgi:hypothetical protein